MKRRPPLRAVRRPVRSPALRYQRHLDISGLDGSIAELFELGMDFLVCRDELLTGARDSDHHFEFVNRHRIRTRRMFEPVCERG
jgi:ribosomal protein L13E